jgi:MATE family multidrug resistance protein
MSSAPLLGSAAPDGSGAISAAVEGHNERRPGSPRGGPAGGTPCASWLGRVVEDTEEAWAQLQFAVPMILMSMAYYGIPLVSVMFSGHLGDVQLAGATLGNSWATVTGYALAVSISNPRTTKSPAGSLTISPGFVSVIALHALTVSGLPVDRQDDK